jgi:hypothetical protein
MNLFWGVSAVVKQCILVGDHTRAVEEQDGTPDER